jgi:hypothetical protein
MPPVYHHDETQILDSQNNSLFVTTGLYTPPESETGRAVIKIEGRSFDHWWIEDEIKPSGIIRRIHLINT